MEGSLRPTFADGEVSSYPRKLTQSMTVTTPSSLNPWGASCRICSASVAGNADPLPRCQRGPKVHLITIVTHLDSMMILSGVNFSLTSIKAFSTSPTIVQHLHRQSRGPFIRVREYWTHMQPFRISDTPVIWD